MISLLKKNPRLNAAQIATDAHEKYVNEETSTRRSRDFSRKILKKAGYRSRVARRKLRISMTNQLKWIAFVKEHINKPPEFWRTIIFSDESKFCIFGIKGRKLENATKLGLGSSFRFQHDNDRKHTAEIVKLWQLYNDPNQQHTPPQSPDLNSIEHLWDLLERKIRGHSISNKDMLKSVVKDEWEKITAEETTKLVDSMPKILIKVHLGQIILQSAQYAYPYIIKLNDMGKKQQKNIIYNFPKRKGDGETYQATPDNAAPLSRAKDGYYFKSIQKNIEIQDIINYLLLFQTSPIEKKPLSPIHRQRSTCRNFEFRASDEDNTRFGNLRSKHANGRALSLDSSRLYTSDLHQRQARTHEMPATSP
ncbi:transposable element Tc1 transposase [Trichonephila clavipes]|nr:transposable element Tc1 transposase [Trichonephila clavipes]